jgi:mannosyl-3-phosphoglycerate phosphatase family protein
MMTIIIFTDLDGTLLDESYSFKVALPALRLLKKYAIPLVIVSSKTRKEIEYYRLRLENDYPFVSENGGGIFIPKKYKEFQPLLEADPFRNSVEEEPDYFVMRLGANYLNLREAIEALRAEGFAIIGFGDMGVDEVANKAGLSPVEAEMAKQRDFDEPFLFKGSKKEFERLSASIRQKRLNLTQGRFYHLLGQSDKGKAVSILTDLYKLEHESVRAIGLGNSLSDLPMLEEVDVPVVVQKPDGSHDPSLRMPRFIKAKGIGPVGWNKIVKELIPTLLLNGP